VSISLLLFLFLAMRDQPCFSQEVFHLEETLSQVSRKKGGFVSTLKFALCNYLSPDLFSIHFHCFSLTRSNTNIVSHSLTHSNTNTQGSDCRAIRTLHTLHNENKDLVRTLLSVTHVRASSQSPLLSSADLTLRSLISDTSWSQVAPILGSGVTETSCIMSWDDLADSSRNVIKTHHEVLVVKCSGMSAEEGCCGF
jgi:hypothetical protein